MPGNQASGVQRQLLALGLAPAEVGDPEPPALQQGGRHFSPDSGMRLGGQQGLAVGMGTHTALPVCEIVLAEVFQVIACLVELRTQQIDDRLRQQALQMTFGQDVRECGRRLHVSEVERGVLGVAPAITAATFITNQREGDGESIQVPLDGAQIHRESTLMQFFQQRGRGNIS